MVNEFLTVLRTYWEQFLFLLPRLLLAAALMAAVLVGSGRLRNWLAAKLSRHTDDPLMTDFLTQVGRWLLVGLGLVLALNVLGMSNLVGGLLGGLGISAFVVGFAFKDIAENFLAGIILAFNRPFSIRDTVQVKDMFGRVVKLNLRSTEIQTFDGRDISIPNSIVLKEPLINFTRNGFIRQDFMVGIDYDDDVSEAIVLIIKELNEEAEVLRDGSHEAFAIIDELAASTVNVKVMFWAHSDDYRRGVLELRSRLMNRVKTALLAAGYGLPPDLLEVRLPAKMPSLPVQVVMAEPGSQAAPPAAPTPAPSPPTTPAPPTLHD